MYASLLVKALGDKLLIYLCKIFSILNNKRSIHWATHSKQAASKTEKEGRGDKEHPDGAGMAAHP